MDIMDMAKDLGQAIAESKEMRDMKTAETIQAGDKEAQELIKNYNIAAMEAAKKMRAEGITKEQAESIRQELGEEFLKLEQNQNILNYISSKKTFEDMVKNVNGVLSYYITGKEQSGCSESGCGGCSGCN